MWSLYNYKGLHQAQIMIKGSQQGLPPVPVLLKMIIVPQIKSLAKEK